MMSRLLRPVLAAALLASTAPPVDARDRRPALEIGAAPDTLAVRATDGFTRPDPLPSPRWNHGAAVVDGKLFVFGGFDGARWTDDAFALDPATGRWTPLPPMPEAPTTVAAAAAGSGRVIVTGGAAQNAGGWTSVPAMGTPRFLSGAVRLRDGRIFVAGGFTSDITSLSTTEIFDPGKRTWSSAAPMSRARYGMAFVELADGRILAAGGRQDRSNSNHVDIVDAEIYDPHEDRWTPTGSLLRPATAGIGYVRPDGKVLVAGGVGNGPTFPTTQIYDPASGTWSYGPPMSTARSSAAGAALKDGRFLVSGGNDERSEQASAEVYDPATERWNPAGAMGQARFSHTMVRLPDGRMLAAGGSRSGGGVRTAEVYDPATDSWSPTGPLRYAHSSGQLAVFGGKAVLVGGQDESGRTQEVEILDPSSLTWSLGPSLSQPRILFAMAALADGTLLAVGGGASGYPAPASATAEALSLRPPRTRANSTLTYSIPAGRWSSGPPLTHERIGLALAAAADRLYALGGIGSGGWGTPDFDVLEDGRWRLAGQLPLHFLSAASAVLDGKIYVAGGSSAPKGQAARRIGDADVFDPATGRWTALPPMPTARLGPAGAALDGKFYVVGGEPELHAPSLNTVEVFDPVNGSWDTKAPLPRGVRHAVAAALNGRLYVVGGSPQDDSASAAVQVYDPRTDRWTVSEQSLVATTPPPLPQRYFPPVQHTPPPANAPVPAPVPHFASKGPERPHDFALVIGVSGYKSLPAADFAENDAREMAGALGALGVPEENVVVLTGAKATLSEVSKYVEEWLPRRVSKDSRVYFYFSGHGAPDVKDGSAYLMPWDGDAAFVKSTGFPLTRLYAALSDLPVARVVAMLDSCFSGAGGRSVLVAGARPLVTVKLPTAASPKISVLTASESEEIAGSAPERGHGLFSYYLLQGLGGAAAPEGTGHLTLEELYGYVRKRVIIDARRQNREQTPTLSSPNPKLRLY